MLLRSEVDFEQIKKHRLTDFLMTLQPFSPSAGIVLVCRVKFPVISFVPLPSGDHAQGEQRLFLFWTRRASFFP